MHQYAHIELKDVYVSGVDTLKRAQGIKSLLFNYRNFINNVRVPILNGISMTIGEGERVGFVGRNGSGKSSLLRVIAGIYPARTGNVRVNGRVAPLIEMGVGFDPEFTGRQNIKIGLLYSGRYDAYSEEMEQKIIDFSELSQKIDMPLKAYSSGMRARLAFSVAVFQEPDILLLDEAFATGDAEFVQKSYLAMKERFSTVPIALLVSHDTLSIEELCTRCIWMESGHIRMDGKPAEVIEQYMASSSAQVPHA